MPTRHFGPLERVRIATKVVAFLLLIHSRCYGQLSSSETPNARESQVTQPPFDALPVYKVTEFGAVGDGQTLNTSAIQRTIDLAADDGGGTIYLPPGTFVTGTLQLKDNTTLYVAQGSTLSGSTNIADYDTNRTHLIYAVGAKNISIAGAGVINGNGPSFWDGGRLEKWLNGQIDLHRTKDMIRFDRCEQINLETVRIKDGAFWNVGFGDCREVRIHRVTIRTGVYEEDGPNTDGINLWNCERVTISDCDIVTGDDCIVVLGNSRDVAITSCLLQTSETALMISGVQNLAFSNSTIRDSGCGIGFRVWTDILVDGVTINNIVMSTSARYKGGGTAIYMWSFPVYTETVLPIDSKLPPPGIVRNVNISNLIATANGLVCVNGYPDAPIQGLTLENVRFTMFGGKISQLNDNPPYPYPIYGFHHASPYGMFFRYVDDLALRNVKLGWNKPENPEWGSALRCWDISDLEISGFCGRQSIGSKQPAISLKTVDGAFIRNCRAIVGTDTFLRLTGDTQSVSLVGNDLRKAKTPIENRTANEVMVDHNQLQTQLGNAEEGQE